MHLPVGTVLKYKNYPYGNDGEVKDYWFLIMGRLAYPSDPICYHLFKTTSRTHYYASGGERSSANFKMLSQSAFPFFDCDCCVDFDFPPESRLDVSKMQDLIANGKVEVMGRIDKQLEELYNLALKGKGASAIIKNDFHSSFNADGITGLKLPSKRSTDYHRNRRSN